MRYGLARGIYANEAGYGTAAVAYGTARSRAAGAAGLRGGDGGVRSSRSSPPRSARSRSWSPASGAAGLTSTAVVAERVRPRAAGAGGWVVAFCAFLFGYTTLIGWAYYGEQCLEYVFGRARRRAVPLAILRPRRARGDQQGRAGVGVGRPDERPADLPEPGGRARAVGRGGGAAARGRGAGARLASERRAGVSGVSRDEQGLRVDGVALAERGRGVRHAALRLQPRRDRGGVRGVRARLRAGAAPAVLRGQGERQRRDPAAARRPRRGRRHRLRRRAAGGRCARASAPEQIVFAGVGKSDAGDRPRPRARDRRDQRRERGGDPAHLRRSPLRAAASLACRCASTRTSTRARTPTSRPACARRSSASTSASHRTSCAARASCPGVELVGLQCHIGSQITDLEPLAAAARALAELSRQLLDEGFALRTIDLGGGLGVSYDGQRRPGPVGLRRRRGAGASRSCR